MLCFDDSGRAYGASPLAGLIRFDPTAGIWSESPELDIALDFDTRAVFPSARGAFAVGRGTGQTVVAFKSDAAGEWRALPGLPPDPQETYEALRVVGGLVGPERALIAWAVDQGTHLGLWASFIE